VVLQGHAEGAATASRRCIMVVVAAARGGGGGRAVYDEWICCERCSLELQSLASRSYKKAGARAANLPPLVLHKVCHRCFKGPPLELQRTLADAASERHRCRWWDRQCYRHG
jgi:hypothetical protein